VPEAALPEPETHADAEPAGRTLSGGAVFTPGAVMGLVGIFVYSMAETALWDFGYYLPVEAGVPEELVGAILSSTVLMGLAGGALAVWLGTRVGRLMPIVVGSLVSVAGRWLFIHSSTAEMVFLAGLLWGLGFYFVTPYQIGLLAALDRTGRLAVAAGAAGNFGYAVGPAVAGRLLQSFEADAFLYVVVGGTAISLVLLLPLAIRVDRDDAA
jgi:MFS family permease